MERKSNNKLIILITILVLVVLVIGGFVLRDKFINKNNEDLDKIATTLLEKIDDYKLDFQGNKFAINSVPTDEQLDAMYQYLLNKYNENLNMTKEIVNKYFEEVYGITPTKYPNIVCKLDNEIIFTFDNSKQAYVRSDDTTIHAHGFNDENTVITQTITNIKKENGNYVLDVAKLYAGAIEHYCSDANCDNILTEFDQFIDEGIELDYDNTSAINYFQNNKEKYKNIKPQYRYTFKLENGNYYLVSYEVIK